MNEKVTISLDYETIFRTKNNTVAPGSALTARIILAIAKNGTLIKNEPASTKTHGYQVWSVPKPVVDLINMVSYGVNNRTIERALSGNLDLAEIASKQEMIDRGLKAKTQLSHGKTVSVSKNPEITIRLTENQPRPLGWFRLYTITANLTTPVKYLIQLNTNDVIKTVSDPKRNVRSHIRNSLYVALLMNDTMLFAIGTSSNNKQQAMAALEVPMKTRSIALTNETSPLVLKAIDTGVSIEVVMALK